MVATNSYAKSHRDDSHIRTWKDTTIGEIYRYIGIWLYMGMHREPVRDVFWSATHQLGRFMPLHRFNQLCRYFSTRDVIKDPR